MASYDPVTGNWIPDSAGGSGGSGSGNVSISNTPIPITDNNGSLTVDGAVNVGNFPATQPVSGTVAVSGTVPVSVSNTPAVTVSSGTVTTNPNLPAVSASTSALTAFRNVALTNTAVAVKASAGRVHQYHFGNPNTAPSFFHFYNVAQASVTVGTTTPMATFMVAANAALDGYWTNSFAFSTAVTVAVTTSATGATAPTNACLVQLGYV